MANIMSTIPNHLKIPCHRLHCNAAVSHPIESNPGNVHSAKPTIVIDPSQKLPVDAAYACAIIVNPQGTKNVAIPAIVDSI
jgi:hypothetical protein